MAECRAFSVPSNVAIPVATPKNAAQWHSEGAAVNTEKVDLTDSVTFSGNEIIKIFSLSLKTQTMAIPAFESYLTTELENCVMATIENSLLSGTGENQGTGLLTLFDFVGTGNESVVRSFGVSATVADYKFECSDIVDLAATLDRAYTNGAKFAMNHRTLWTQIYQMADNNNRPLFIQDLQNQGIGKILGFDIVIDDNIPDYLIIFGNFQYMAYNLPQGIVIETSRESSFKQGLIDYRAITIADTKPLLKEAFAVLGVGVRNNAPAVVIKHY